MKIDALPGRITLVHVTSTEAPTFEEDGNLHRQEDPSGDRGLFEPPWLSAGIARPRGDWDRRRVFGGYRSSGTFRGKSDRHVWVLDGRKPCRCPGRGVAGVDADGPGFVEDHLLVFRSGSGECLSWSRGVVFHHSLVWSVYCCIGRGIVGRIVERPSHCSGRLAGHEPPHSHCRFLGMTGGGTAGTLVFGASAMLFGVWRTARGSPHPVVGA